MSTETNISALPAEHLDAAERSAFKILLAVSICHLLNDTVQSLLPALYPLLRSTFRLNFGQVGLIAFTATFTSSLLQPLVGLYRPSSQTIFPGSRHGGHPCGPTHPGALSDLWNRPHRRGTDRHGFRRFSS